MHKNKFIVSLHFHNVVFLFEYYDKNTMFILK